MPQQVGVSTSQQQEPLGQTFSSNSSTKISSPTPDMPTKFKYWAFVPEPTPLQLFRVYDNIRLMLPDHVSWLDFANLFNDSYYFECPSGWFTLRGIIPGASAEFHGGAFEKRVNPDHEEELIDFLQYVMREADVKLIHTPTPSHLKVAKVFLARIGFIECGIIPFAGLWQGVPRNFDISFLSLE